MENLKKFIKNNKVLLIVLAVGLVALGIELFLVNNLSDKKTNTRPKEVINNKSNLTEEQKTAMGVNSNQNEESNSNVTNSNIKNIIEKEKEKKEEENKSDAYKEYEKLTEEEKKEIEVIPDKNNTSIDEIDNIKDNYEEIILPAKFNLKDKIKLNYENQGNFGLCWDFAAMKSLETFLALNNYGQYDFSEIAVDYFASELLFGSYRVVHSGGMFTTFVESVTLAGGLIDDSKLEYRDYAEEEYIKFLDIEKDEFVVTEYVKFPNIRKRDGKFYDSEKDKELTNEEFVAYIELIKKHVMTKGSLTTAVSVSEWPYCDNDCAYADHAISLVGWDDDYSKDNFERYLCDDAGENCKNVKPNNNGAFIFVNSWSEEEEYIYMSYEDGFIYTDLHGVLSVTHENSINIDNLSPNLRQAIIEKFSGYLVESNGIRYLTKAVADTIWTLDLSGYQLNDSDLSYLSIFTNLDTLILDDNNITDLSYMPNFENLSSLSLANNNISDLSTLPYYSDLFHININNNSISDISPLNKYPELNSVVANNNNIIDISNFNNKSVSVFSLSGNKNISGYDNLTNVDGYLSLDLSNCNITTFTGNNETRYYYLILSNNPNLVFNNNIKVGVLEASNNNYTNVDFISHFDKDYLSTLVLKDNDIVSIKPMTQFKSLTTIDLSGNKNIADLGELKTLYYTEEVDNASIVNSVLGTIFSDIRFMYDELIEDTEDVVEEDDDEYEEMEPFIYKALILNNCNISDITIFNEFNDIDNLSLADNNIETLNNFKINETYSINLSNNKIKDNSYSVLFQDDLNEVNLSNCGLKDISGFKNISRDNYIGTLNLANNDIKDLTPLDGLEISILSLEGNKNVQKFFTNIVDLGFVNLSNMNLTDEILNLETFKDLYGINLSNNPNITAYNKLYTEDYSITVYAYGNSISYSNMNNFDCCFYGDNVIVDSYESNNGIITLNRDDNLYNTFLNHVYRVGFPIKLEKGVEFNKYYDQIKVTGVNEFNIRLEENYDDLYTTNSEYLNFKFILN